MPISNNLCKWKLYFRKPPRDFTRGHVPATINSDISDTVEWRGLGEIINNCQKSSYCSSSVRLYRTNCAINLRILIFIMQKYELNNICRNYCKIVLIKSYILSMYENFDKTKNILLKIVFLIKMCWWFWQWKFPLLNKSQSRIPELSCLHWVLLRHSNTSHCHWYWFVFCCHLTVTVSTMIRRWSVNIPSEINTVTVGGNR